MMIEKQNNKYLKKAVKFAYMVLQAHQFISAILHNQARRFMKNVGGVQYSEERTYFYRGLGNSQTVSPNGGLCPLDPHLVAFHAS